MKYIVRHLDGGKVRFLDNGQVNLVTNVGVLLEGVHYQDCCEEVYVDWSSLKDTDFFDREFEGIEIELVEGVGFRINEYLVNCYNEQNGYYSSSLILKVVHPTGNTEEIDLAGYMIDRIY